MYLSSRSGRIVEEKFVENWSILIKIDQNDEYRLILVKLTKYDQKLSQIWPKGHQTIRPRDDPLAASSGSRRPIFRTREAMNVKIRT